MAHSEGGSHAATHAPNRLPAVSLGVSLYTGQRSGGGAMYRDLAVLAQAAEAAGFDAFWVSEHHDMEDGYLPSPLVGLAAAAQATDTIVLGTGLVLGPLAHPLRLAEDAVVVDHLSGGRLILGVGIGYAPGEYRMFEIPMAARGRRLAETIEILRQAWTGERFSYHGRVYSFDNVRVRPPAPHRSIPVWLGGYAEAAVRRAGRMADGHLVGRGAADLVAGAETHLKGVRDPLDSSFTLGMNLALIGDDPEAGGRSAAASFARQQRAYEQVQAGTDVYAELLTISASEQLDLGAIDSYVQLRGGRSDLVRGIVEHIRAYRHWARLHVALRVLFPDEDLDTQLRRLAYLGEAVLPEVHRSVQAMVGPPSGARSP